MARILIADDDAKLRGIIAYALQREGYDVVTAGDGEEALARIEHDAPHLVILDLMMPKLGGLEVCRRIRTHSAIPILMLTARSAESDKVEGLELGADDYLTKPFSPRELLARIKALLRRAGTETAAPGAVTVGGLTIDFPHRMVTVDGRDAQLTPLEFHLLACLADRPGDVLSAKQLVKLLYHYDCTEQEALALMRVNVSRLRQKIEAAPSRPQYVRTVRGFGYALGPPNARKESSSGLAEGPANPQGQVARAERL